MTVYAHTREGFPPSSWEPLSVHLDNVSQSAADFADAFGSLLRGDVLGRCHDLGKLSNEFQRYLHDAGMKSVDDLRRKHGVRRVGRRPTRIFL